MASKGYLLIGFAASQSSALIWRVLLKADADPQIPATVQAALMNYGKMFSLVTALVPKPAPSPIPLIS